HRADGPGRRGQPRLPHRNGLRPPPLPDAGAVSDVMARRHNRLSSPDLAHQHPQRHAPVRLGRGLPELHGPDTDGLAPGVLRRRGDPPDSSKEAVRPEPLLHIPPVAVAPHPPQLRAMVPLRAARAGAAAHRKRGQATLPYAGPTHGAYAARSRSSAASFRASGINASCPTAARPGLRTTQPPQADPSTAFITGVSS